MLASKFRVKVLFSVALGLSLDISLKAVGASSKTDFSKKCVDCHTVKGIDELFKPNTGANSESLNLLQNFELSMENM